MATPGVLAAMRASGDLPFEYLYRHIHGDWGQLEQADVWENELGLIRGFRLVSAYTLKSGVKIYIITEAVNDDGFRESTCILLPEEY